MAHAQPGDFTHQQALLSLLLAAHGPLNQAIAGAAMAVSSVFVVSNSLRLRRVKAVSTAADSQLPRQEARS